MPHILHAGAIRTPATATPSQLPKARKIIHKFYLYLKVRPLKMVATKLQTKFVFMLFLIKTYKKVSTENKTIIR